VYRHDGWRRRLAFSPHSQWLVALVPLTAEPVWHHAIRATAAVDSRLAPAPDDIVRHSVRASMRRP
jgi:hypothetical protein